MSFSMVSCLSYSATRNIAAMKSVSPITLVSGTAPVMSKFNGYDVYFFTADAQFRVKSAVLNIAVVGGGGAGGDVGNGGNGAGGTGGGGGGGVVYFQTPQLLTEDVVTVHVGAGGTGGTGLAGPSTSGGGSSVAFASNTALNRAAPGGGFGARYGSASASVSGGNSGGSGTDSRYFGIQNNADGVTVNRGGFGAGTGGGGGGGAGTAGYGSGGYLNKPDTTTTNGSSTIIYCNNATGTPQIAVGSSPVTAPPGGQGINIPLSGFNPNWFFGGGGGGSSAYGSKYGGSGGKGGGGGGGYSNNASGASGLGDKTWTAYSSTLATDARTVSNNYYGGNGAANSGGGGGGVWPQGTLNVAGSGGSGAVIVVVVSTI